MAWRNNQKGAGQSLTSSRVPQPRRQRRLISLRDIFYNTAVSSASRKRRPVQIELEARPQSSSKTGAQSIHRTSSHGIELASAEIPASSSTEAVDFSGELRECPLCALRQPKENFPVLMTCSHRSCRDCLRQYLRIEITESRVNIACPECSEKLHPNDIKQILKNENLLKKYEEFMIRRLLVSDPDARWCPAPDCGYAVIATGCASCPKLMCERAECGTLFCYHCKQFWHPNQTCDMARAERSNYHSSSFTYSPSQSQDSCQNEIKPCPRCGAFIVKMDDGSCNHMTCAVCGAEFCWLCMREISDLHYLSPSGCTFWGKKPWSRKKKILWQLGTLIGAPIGISLIAGIAMPAIIIGMPIWVGRKISDRCQHMSKHKRNLTIAGGVTASILVSPALAAFAVGVGVPILLAYVYGVVPISLCRSGGCGLSATKRGGVRIDFDERNDVPVGPAPVSCTADARSMNDMDAPHVTNPSIGPSIGEMSFGLTGSLSVSGSHLERIGVIQEDSCDQDLTNRNVAAGSSVSDTFSANQCPAGESHSKRHLPVTEESGNVHKSLQVQVEVSHITNSQKNQDSISSESGSTSYADTISTKALAGSICARDRDDCSAVILSSDCPTEMTQVTTSAIHHQLYSNANNSAICHKASMQDSSSGCVPDSLVHERDSRSSPVDEGSSDCVKALSSSSKDRDGRVKMTKRQSMSMEEYINERGKSNSDYFSVQSLCAQGQSEARSSLMSNMVAASHIGGTQMNTRSTARSALDILPEVSLRPGLTEVETSSNPYQRLHQSLSGDKSTLSPLMTTKGFDLKSEASEIKSFSSKDLNQPDRTEPRIDQLVVSSDSDSSVVLNNAHSVNLSQ